MFVRRTVISFPHMMRLHVCWCKKHHSFIISCAALFFCELTWKGEIATGGRRVGLSLPTPVTVCRPKTGSTLRFVSSFRHRLAVSRKKRRTALGPILQRETSISDRRQCRTKRFFSTLASHWLKFFFAAKTVICVSYGFSFVKPKTDVASCAKTQLFRSIVKKKHCDQVKNTSLRAL